MARTEYAIRSYLLASTALSALISTRMYPLKMPQDATLPNVVYQRVSTQRHHAMGSDPALIRPRLQLDCYSTGYVQAKNVAEKLVTRLTDAGGTLGSTGVQITNAAVLPVDESDSYEEDTGYYRVRVDAFVFGEE